MHLFISSSASNVSWMLKLCLTSAHNELWETRRACDDGESSSVEDSLTLPLDVVRSKNRRLFIRRSLRATGTSLSKLNIDIVLSSKVWSMMRLITCWFILRGWNLCVKRFLFMLSMSIILGKRKISLMPFFDTKWKNHDIFKRIFCSLENTTKKE